MLDLESRRKIYDIVGQYAGYHMREIRRASGMSFGMVSYHLSNLQKHRLIREEQDGNYLRYFPFTLGIHDEKLLSLLRQSIRPEYPPLYHGARRVQSPGHCLFGSSFAINNNLAPEKTAR